MENKPNINELRGSKAEAEELANDITEKYKIIGRTIDKWEEFFKFSIPIDASPSQCREILIKISALLQEASRQYRESQMRRTSIKIMCQERRAEAYKKIYQGYFEEHRVNKTRMPSKDAIKEEVESEIIECLSYLDHIDIAVNYFKQVIEYLSNQRKIIEDIGIQLGIEGKMSHIN